MGKYIFAACLGSYLLLAASTQSAWADEPQEPAPSNPDWRRDPSVQRHPGSYIGGALGYVQSRAWLSATEEHQKLTLGPIHTMGGYFRVGDAFAEWFAVGFKIAFNQGSKSNQSITSFALFLDTTFYPWRGLGLRPAVGFGFATGQGKNDWDNELGGPLSFAFDILWEFRLRRLLVIAPVAEIYYITGEEFDGLFLFFGIELLKWFETATG